MSSERWSIELSSGRHAVITGDQWRPGTYTLVVDGTPQSHVDLQHPDELAFEYVRRIGNVIDAMPGGAITAVHLGAGGLTLPRYVHATRPGSRQQVIELERELVEFVREHLPLPRQASIRVRYGDAREGLRMLPGGLRGSVELLVIDVFGGARIPAHVTSVEFYRECRALLSPRGIVAVNLADGPGLTFARGQLSTLAAAFEDCLVLADSGVLRGRRFGNIVAAASIAPFPAEWMPALLAGGPHPASALHGAELRNWVAGAPLVTDAMAVASPAPDSGVFRTR